jgi:hypothetical protein
VSWTIREENLIKALIKATEEGYAKPLKHAADEVRMDYAVARGTMHRIRVRHDKMREALDTYTSWRRQIKGAKRYL